MGKDVAEALGYTNPQKAIRDHVDEDDKLTERIVLSGQNREVVIINESGLYSLILSSSPPSSRSSAKPRNAIAIHVDDEDKQNCQNSSFESPRGMTIINESGLYSLVLSSSPPSSRSSIAFLRGIPTPVLKCPLQVDTEAYGGETSCDPNFKLHLRNTVTP